MSLYLLVYTSFAGNNMGLMVHVFCLAISTVVFTVRRFLLIQLLCLREFTCTNIKRK